MQIAFRTLKADDVDYIVQQRVEFILDLHPEMDSMAIEKLELSSRLYFEDQQRKNCYTGIVGEVAASAVCCAGILHYDLPPLTADTRKTGHILNFFTYPEHRRKGYASAMMNYIIELAVKEGFERLFLNATEMGETLYRKFGFCEQKEKALLLKLQ